MERKYRNHTFPIMVRDDLPLINETLDAIESADFLVILGGSKTYSLHWTHVIPTTLSIFSDGIERYFWYLTISFKGKLLAGFGSFIRNCLRFKEETIETLNFQDTQLNLLTVFGVNYNQFK
jgi:hypothetical protein